MFFENFARTLIFMCVKLRLIIISELNPFSEKKLNVNCIVIALPWKIDRIRNGDIKYRKT